MRLFSFALILLSLFLLSGCSDNHAKSRKYLIGIIQYTDTNEKTLTGFKNEMVNLGYIEGENVKYLSYGNANSFEEIEFMLKKIIEQKPDIIFSSTTPASTMAYKLTKGTGIPVVFAPVNDPVGAGIIKNLSTPGENITGIRLAPSDSKRLEWMKVLKPDVRNVLVPYNPMDKSSNISILNISKDAESLKLNIITYKANNKFDIEYLLQNLPDGLQAVFLPRDGLIMSHASEFAVICNEKKLILSTPRYEQVKDGATMGYGFIDEKLGMQAARIAVTILRGANPGDIPVETAEDYLFINHESAGKIGLKVSDMILMQTYKQ